MSKRKAPADLTEPSTAKRRSQRLDSTHDAPVEDLSAEGSLRTPSRSSVIAEANALSGSDFNYRYLNDDSLFLENKNGLSFKSATASDLPAWQLDQCFRLIESTSRPDYEASTLKWKPRHKRREMREPGMRYLYTQFHERHQVAGFLSYMLTHDSTPSVPVLYIYEVHLKSEVRGKGLGKWFMQMAEEIAREVGVEKVMLTCFVSNTKARQFYERLGYVVDECSPADRKTRNKVVKVDYVIMSKRLEPPVQMTSETERDAISLGDGAASDEQDATSDKEDVISEPEDATQNEEEATSHEEDVRRDDMDSVSDDEELDTWHYPPDIPPLKDCEPFMFQWKQEMQQRERFNSQREPGDCARWAAEGVVRYTKLQNKITDLAEFYSRMAGNATQIAKMADVEREYVLREGKLLRSAWWKELDKEVRAEYTPPPPAAAAPPPPAATAPPPRSQHRSRPSGTGDFVFRRPQSNNVW